MKIRQFISLSVVALGVFAAAGCASVPPIEVGTSAPASAPSEVGEVTRDASQETASGLASGGGVLAVSNGCVILEGGMVPVFPSAEVVWDGTTLVWGGNEYVVGDEISFGGGLIADDIRADLVPIECGDGSAWAVSAN